MKAKFARVIFILALLYTPVVVIWCLFGMSGSNPYPFAIIFLGHLVTVCCAWFARKDPRFFAGVLVGLLVLGFGTYLDKKFWAEENAKTCAQIKSDPHCIENEAGFVCKDPSPLGNMTTAKGVCQ